MTVTHHTNNSGSTYSVCRECPLCKTEIKEQGSLAKHLRYDCEVNNE